MKRKPPKSLHTHTTVNQSAFGVHFDFRYMSEDATYNKAKTAHWMKLFIDLKQISSKSWTDAMQTPRQARQGYEKITQDVLKKPLPSPHIPHDAKLDVIRVAGSNDARLIGYKPQNSNVFYVLWLDFDFSVYHHG